MESLGKGIWRARICSGCRKKYPVYPLCLAFTKSCRVSTLSIDGRTGGAVGIGGEVTLVGVVAKQQFIADHALIGGEDGLPRDARARFFRSWLRLCAHGFSVCHRRFPAQL